MPLVIGTAGHIDHGKTTLVKALTGQDTDRLKEEKERGISIDLGFAHLDLPDGTRAGVVDVPGHERFIRNMLAGAHGIDLVLFTVAADDGVMPQTEEHLDIVHLLGIQRAVFVITKADLVSEARIQEVEEEIAVLTSGTALERSPVVPFSSVTGRGLEQLRAQISQAVQTDLPREGRGYFRLPVDRVFVLQGHGLVVTGTAVSGAIRVGDRVRCLPGDQIFRVRSLQVHGQPMEVALWGQRVALNLSGQEKASIERGDVVCHEKITMTSDRFDASLEVRGTATAGIKSHQRVRVHLGTAERLGTLILLGSQQKVGAKGSALCQLALSEPLLALRGDRFIIRDETAQRTIGGGLVLHPWAKKHKRGEPALQQRLELLRGARFDDVVGIFLGETESFALPISPLHQFVNLPEDEVIARLERMDTVRVFSLEEEKLYTTETKWQRLRERLLQLLREFHAAHPLAVGMEMEEIRDRLPTRLAPRLFRAVVEQLEAEATVSRDASLLRLPDHKIRLREEEKSVVEKVKALLGANPFAPPDLKQMEVEIGIGRAKLVEVLRVMERERLVVRVSAELYFLSASIDKLKADLYQHLSERSDVTPATFRDLFGTTRKYTIPLLEYLDREGITVRVGDARRLKQRIA